MFVVISNFSNIKEGKDDEFRERFARTNKAFANSRVVSAGDPWRAATMPLS